MKVSFKAAKINLTEICVRRGIKFITISVLIAIIVKYRLNVNSDGNALTYLRDLIAFIHT